jgi:hypothetical protein
MLSYRGPQDVPLNTASLRRALDLFSSAEHMEFDWDASETAPPQEDLLTLPPTLPHTSATTSLKLRSLSLSLLDKKSHKVACGKLSQPLISQHLSQIVPIIALPGLQKLDLRLEYSCPKKTVARGFSSFGDSLRGLKCEGLKRLGIMSTHYVVSQLQVSESWVSHYDQYS